MKMTIPAAALATMLLCVVPGAFAQPYPVKSIRVIAGFPPGSGAASNIAADLAAKSFRDGYTLFIGTVANTIYAALYKKLPYDALRDFAPVSLLVEQPNIMVAHPSIGVQTLKDFIAMARSAPGKLTYGSAGTGSGTHLAMELLLLTNNLELVHVPYKGTGPALIALLGSEISVFLSTFASALPYVKAGRLRTFGVTGAQRAPTLPEVPTIAEAGMPGYEYTTWYGLLVPARTPRAMIEKLHTTTVSLLNSTELKHRYSSQGMEPIPSAPGELSAKLKPEIEKWGKVVRAAKIPQQ